MSDQTGCKWPAPGSVVVIQHPNGAFVRAIRFPATASEQPVTPDEHLLFALHNEVLALRLALAETQRSSNANGSDEKEQS